MSTHDPDCKKDGINLKNLVRAITSDGCVSVLALDSTAMAAQAEQIHHSSAVVTAALGRLLTAASMMGCVLKGEDSSLTLRIRGDGPIGSMIAVSDASGNVRGCVGQPVVELPLNAKGKLDVGGAVGQGTLFVLKDTGGKEPYVGSVPLVSGEIAEDITSYYAASEQVPTVCALGVLVNPDLSVRAAGGYLIQLLPTADEEIISKVERSLEGVKPVSQMVDEGMSPMEICRAVLGEFEVEELFSAEVGYRCNCSRQRVEAALISLGDEELHSLAKEQELTSIQCHFCDKEYSFSSSQIETLRKKCGKPAEDGIE